MYFQSPNPIGRGIDLFEWFEHHGEPTYFYHTAIALGPSQKIEADRRISIRPIVVDDTYLVYRPPIPKSRVDKALEKIKEREGELYGFLLVIDDALRYPTRGRLHVPEWIMKRYHDDDCSSLVALYFHYAEWGPKLGRHASPEDIWLAVKDYPVAG